ncbi:hypothetical protein [Armatimonas sp.]|uniref:hypothetical protein n=1 Tax=Armatimonas sp. TaxID=1872638 RepID=UPI00286C5AA9|nr:hypothetical protein [Armatimonas sp.]
MSTLALPWIQDEPSLADANLSNDAYAKLVEGLLKVATDAADKLVVSGNESPREVAMEALNVYVLAMMLGAAGAVGTGTATGAVIGGVATAWTGPGLVLGAAVGGGIGLMVGMVPVLIIGMAYIDAIDRVNTKYPPTAQTASLLRLAPQAGRSESFAVHLLTLFIPGDLGAIADRWDAAPNLPSAVRGFLARHRFLQPSLQRLIRLIRTQKASANAFSIRPISQFDATRSIVYRQQPEQNWLEWMGLTTLKLRADDAKLTMTLPRALTEVGAPARLRTDLPNFNIRVGGDGGAIPYIQFGLKPSAFDMTLGETRLLTTGRDRGKVRLSFRIAKGATLGSASGSFKWGPGNGALTFASPKLTEALSVEVFLKPEGGLLAFDHVEVGDLRLSLETPDLIKNLPGIGGLIDQIIKGIVGFFKNLFTTAISWASQFQQLAGYSIKALEAALAQTARTCGVLALSGLQQLQSTGNSLQVLVRATTLRLPEIKDTIMRLALLEYRFVRRSLWGARG